MTNTQNKSDKSTASDFIVSEIEIAAPAKRVFQALTDERELTLWFTNPECPVKHWKMDARPGGHYRYATEKGTIVVNGVSEFECHGEIVEIVPPRLLVYTWIANWHENKSLRTIVRWELTPAADGTHVKVTHSGLASEPTAHKDYSGGWPGVMQMLKNFAEQEKK
ncbi:MAG: SRPBCC domain-containing protein [Candidatus Sulfotelmatobacter sp.]